MLELNIVYSDIKGMMFVDIDEFLFCPKEQPHGFQRMHVKKILNNLYDKDKIDELRIDVHPYAAINESFTKLKVYRNALDLNHW